MKFGIRRSLTDGDDAHTLVEVVGEDTARGVVRVRDEGGYERNVHPDSVVARIPASTATPKGSG
jgi:hypothetical protein